MGMAAFGAFSIFGLIFGLGVYLLPTIIAVTRKPVNMTAAILVNVFLGWSFIGWIIALVLALGTKQPAYPAPFYPPVGYQPAGGYQQTGVYQQGYGVPTPQTATLPPTQTSSAPAWGTPGPTQQVNYPPSVSDAPYGTPPR